MQCAGRNLRYELDRNHLGFVVWSENQHDGGSNALAVLERAALALVAALDTGKPPLVPRAHKLIASWVGTRQVSDAEVTRPLRLDGEAFPSVLAGLGSLARGVEGFARTPEEALHARTVARLTHGLSGSVTRYGDVAAAALASVDVESARDLITEKLGPLAAKDEQALRISATLHVYLEENMSPLRASRRLGVHENTITNRVRAAQELLPHPIEQRSCELQLALRLIGLTRGD